MLMQCFWVVLLALEPQKRMLLLAFSLVVWSKYTLTDTHCKHRLIHSHSHTQYAEGGEEEETHEMDAGRRNEERDERTTTGNKPRCCRSRS